MLPIYGSANNELVFILTINNKLQPQWLSGVRHLFCQVFHVTIGF